MYILKTHQQLADVGCFEANNTPIKFDDIQRTDSNFHDIFK